MARAAHSNDEIKRRAEAHRRFVTSIAHPLRHQLLVRLHVGIASPKELAEALDEPLGRVSHHIRALRDVGAIELVRTEQRRGAVEHYYRAAGGAYFSDEDWARMPLGDRRHIFGQVLQRIGGDIAGALANDGFDHPRAWVAFLWLDLDEQAMAEVSAVLSETLDRVTEINARSSERHQPNREAERRLTTELALLHFERVGPGEAATA
jgi:DNA-binding transcriptional ArsR family regulator